MIDEFLPLAVRQIRVHLEPINIRSGPERLRALCVAELGREPEPTEAFLFVNKARDVLVVYCVDTSGDRTVSKKLEKGAFLLPAPDVEGAKWVALRRRMISKLFRSG